VAGLGRAGGRRRRARADVAGWGGLAGLRRRRGSGRAVAAARAAEQARDLQDAAAALLTRTRAEEEALRRRAAALQGELRRLHEAAAAHADSDKVRSSRRTPALCVSVRARVPPEPPVCL